MFGLYYSTANKSTGTSLNRSSQSTERTDNTTQHGTRTQAMQHAFLSKPPDLNLSKKKLPKINRGRKKLAELKRLTLCVRDNQPIIVFAWGNSTQCRLSLSEWVYMYRQPREHRSGLLDVRDLSRVVARPLVFNLGVMKYLLVSFRRSEDSPRPKSAKLFTLQKGISFRIARTHAFWSILIRRSVNVDLYTVLYHLSAVDFCARAYSSKPQPWPSDRVGTCQSSRHWHDEHSLCVSYIAERLVR